MQPTQEKYKYEYNGKELDTETGYYYYGARYYNPATSVWLATDPLAEKYSFQSQEKDNEIKGIGTKQKILFIFA